jgi:hypothetical protein
MGSVWFIFIFHRSSFIVHFSLPDLRHSAMTNERLTMKKALTNTPQKFPALTYGK